MLTGELRQVTNAPIMPISGVSGEGIEPLLRALLKNVEEVRDHEKLTSERRAAGIDEDEEIVETWSPV